MLAQLLAAGLLSAAVGGEPGPVFGPRAQEAEEADQAGADVPVDCHALSAAPCCMESCVEFAQAAQSLRRGLE